MNVALLIHHVLLARHTGCQHKRCCCHAGQTHRTVQELELKVRILLQSCCPGWPLITRIWSGHKSSHPSQRNRKLCVTIIADTLNDIHMWLKPRRSNRITCRGTSKNWKLSTHDYWKWVWIHGYRTHPEVEYRRNLIIQKTPKPRISLTFKVVCVIMPVTTQRKNRSVWRIPSFFFILLIDFCLLLLEPNRNSVQ